MMRVCVVCYEDPDGWILGKIARKLSENLNALGCTSWIARAPVVDADINYHVFYGNYRPSDRGNDVLMVTHIDSLAKQILLKLQLQSALHAICMSSDAVKNLTEKGIPSNKLSYVNPAHEFVVRPRKLRLGLMTNNYEDGRKNGDFLPRIFELVPAEHFKLVIMGTGWDEIVSRLRASGLDVEHFTKFEHARYVELVPTLDFLLYFGFDEGSMSFLDAAAAAVPTIVTPQGFHLDAPGALTYPVTSAVEVAGVLNKIVEERQARVNAVQSWTWNNFASEHQLIFERVLGRERTAGTAVSRRWPQLGMRAQRFSYVALSWPSAKYWILKSKLRGLRMERAGKAREH